MTWTKQRLNNLFFFIGIAAVVVMLLTFDVSFVELWQHLCHAGYWLIPIIGVWLIIYGFNALSWRCIIKSIMRRNADESEKQVGWWKIYQMTITGYALNYATPVGGLGGEPYRVMELSRFISKQHATSSVILYAMMHIYGHFWFWLISIFIYLGLVAIGDLPLNIAIGTLLSGIATLFIIAFFFFSKGYRKGLVVRTMHWLSKVPGLKKWSNRFQTNHAEAMQNVDQQIAALYTEDRQSFYNSLIIEIFSRIVQSSEVFFMLLLFGIDGGGTFSGLFIVYLHSILIVSFTSFLANLIGFLPMQIGVQEGGFVVSIAALGFSAALGIFVSIICRVRETLWIFIGIMLMRMKSNASH